MESGVTQGSLDQQHIFSNIAAPTFVLSMASRGPNFSSRGWNDGSHTAYSSRFSHCLSGTLVPFFYLSDDWHSNKTIRRCQMPYILYTCEVRPDGRGVSVGCFIIMHLKFSSCARLAAQGWRLFLLVDLVTVCEISWVFPSLIGLQLSQNGYNL